MQMYRQRDCMPKDYRQIKLLLDYSPHLPYLYSSFGRILLNCKYNNLLLFYFLMCIFLSSELKRLLICRKNNLHKLSGIVADFGFIINFAIEL
jgi:hypothetical protein